jgi:hypothetical protein
VRIVRIALATLLALWMLADGTHALLTGSYITGTLGPWAAVLSAARIDPLGTPVKLAFLVLGISWLVHVRNVVVRKVIRPATIVLCVLTLWYLPFGTITAVFELAAEFVPALRRAST